MITDAMVRAAQSALRNVRYGLSDNEMKLALDAALSSAHPALAQEVEVKPLIWAWNDFLDAWEADTAIGRYQAWQINNVGVVKFPHAADGRIVDGAIDAAKAAAQQDYESRIRSAIVSPAGAPVDPPFKPCIIRYDDASVTEMVLEDCPTITGTEMTVRPLLRMSEDKDDRPIIGFQWDNAPKHSPPATDKLALAREEKMRCALAFLLDIIDRTGAAAKDVLDASEAAIIAEIRDEAGAPFAALSTIEESDHA